MTLESFLEDNCGWFTFWSKKIFVPGYDQDDLKQAGMVFVSNALKKVDLNHPQATGYLLNAYKFGVLRVLSRHGVSIERHQYKSDLADNPDEGFSLESLPSSEPDPLERLLEQERYRELYQAIEALEPQARGLLDGLLKDMSVAKSARAVGLTESQGYKLLRETLLRLKSMILSQRV